MINSTHFLRAADWGAMNNIVKQFKGDLKRIMEIVAEMPDDEQKENILRETLTAFNCLKTDITVNCHLSILSLIWEEA